MRGEAILAKITRPRLTLTRQRTDLLNLLDALRTAPLIIISGPYGTGKTALVAGYADTRNIPCLWYQVDHGDEDLANFFHYLDLAARELSPYKKAKMPQPTPECLTGDSAAVTKYFSELYRCLTPPFLMIFDNYRGVSEGAILHRVIKDACMALPIGGRIILIASNDCPPTASWLRVNRSTAIVTWQDLQLNPAKVKEIAALYGLTLSLDDAVEQMRKKVGGWAAALVLSLQKSRDD